MKEVWDTLEWVHVMDQLFDQWKSWLVLCENLMAGKVVIEKMRIVFWSCNKGWRFNMQGGVGARTGIDMKGGTIIIGGDAGAFTGFMMQEEES